MPVQFKLNIFAAIQFILTLECIFVVDKFKTAASSALEKYCDFANIKSQLTNKTKVQTGNANF